MNTRDDPPQQPQERESHAEMLLRFQRMRDEAMSPETREQLMHAGPRPVLNPSPKDADDDSLFYF